MNSYDSIWSGWWYTYPFEKYESQLELGWLFPIYGKIKNVPNHQPEYDMCSTFFIKPPEMTLQIGYRIGLLGQLGSALQSALSPSNSKGRSKGTVKILMTGGGTASVGMPWSLAKLSHLNALWKEHHKTITSKIVQIHPKKQASACTSSHLCPQKKSHQVRLPRRRPADGTQHLLWRRLGRRWRWLRSRGARWRGASAGHLRWAKQRVHGELFYNIL